ncbi:MAG: ABC transporter permease [Cytophagales bacterium]
MSEQKWNIEIKPKTSLFELNLQEVFRYKDLLVLFIKRDVTTLYKQTILGPLWYIIQPLFTTLVFNIVFFNIAGIKPGLVPPFLFYLSGTCLWTYFSDSFINTSRSFTDNSGIFGKVYFPRLVLPFSKVISGMLKFLIQFVLFLVFYIYYFFFTESQLHLNFNLLFVPVIIFLMMILALGLGLIVSSLTTKYRDLQHLLTFGIQLLMYATPVIYPMQKVADKWYGHLLWYNPLSSFMELFRFAFFGEYGVSILHLTYSVFVCLLIFLIGLIMFNKHEKTFMDTV